MSKALEYSSKIKIYVLTINFVSRVQFDLNGDANKVNQLAKQKESQHEHSCREGTPVLASGGSRAPWQKQLA